MRQQISRRQFGEWLAVSGLAPNVQVRSPSPSGPSVAEPARSHIGSLYPFVQKQADRSSLKLSFLRSEFQDLEKWQLQARAKIFEHLFYAPPAVDPQPQLRRRTDKGDYVEEYLTFQTTPDLRIPAYVLVPKNRPFPAPGAVVLHDHGAFYLWGKEKMVETQDEHPVLADFKQRLYGGKSIACELVRQGYVVVTIDMFYWGERRMVLDDDPPAYREPRTMTKEQVAAFHRRSQDAEQLMARSLFAAGITWSGVILWDDIRTVDYLVSRPEVDPNRIACVGLSVGGYRSFVLPALDRRIKAAVDVGWMSSFASHIRENVIHSIGLTFHIIGLYHYLDLPDLAALIAPRAVLVINGSRDRLFPPQGVRGAFEKIQRCYAKAGMPERQRCSLYDAPHEFNPEMQAEAWEWLRRWV